MRMFEIDLYLFGGRGGASGGFSPTGAQRDKMKKLESFSEDNLSYGKRTGAIHFSKGEKGDIKFRYKTERYIHGQKSATIGVGDTKAKIRSYEITGMIGLGGKTVFIGKKITGERTA